MDSLSAPHRRLSQGVYFGTSKIIKQIGSVGMVVSAYAAGTVLPEHSHEHDHLVLVVKGHYEETIAGTRVERKPNQLLYLPRDVPHAERHLTHGRHFMIDPPPDWLDLDRVDRSPSAQRRLLDVLPEDANRLARELHTRFLDPDWVSPITVEVLLLDLLIHCNRARPVARARRPPAFLRRAIDIFCTRYVEPLTIGDVARKREVNVCPRRLARTFQTWYGASFRQLLLERRLEFVYRQVRHTNTPISQIADAAGFFDQSHLGKTFRRTFRMSPDGFRRDARRCGFGQRCDPKRRPIFTRRRNH